MEIFAVLPQGREGRGAVASLTGTCLLPAHGRVSTITTWVENVLAAQVNRAADVICRVGRRSAVEVRGRSREVGPTACPAGSGTAPPDRHL